MNDHEIDKVLGEAGTVPVEPPDPQFASTLEERLFAMHGRLEHDVPAPRARMIVPALVGVAAALVVAVVLVASRTDEPSLQLTAAQGVEVVLPDGSVVPGEVGLDLPDGSLIRTEEGGSGSVGDVDIPGASEAVVEGGTVRLVDDLAAAPAPTTTTTTAPPTTTVTGPPGEPTQPTSSPTTTRVEPVPPSSTTTSRPAPARLELRATRAPEGRVELHWTAYLGDDFARYVLIRTTTTDAGERVSQAVFQTEDQGRLAFIDRIPPERPQVAYRVVALNGDGEIVAASPTVQPG